MKKEPIEQLAFYTTEQMKEYDEEMSTVSSYLLPVCACPALLAVVAAIQTQWSALVAAMLIGLPIWTFMLLLKVAHGTVKYELSARKSTSKTQKKKKDAGNDD